MTAMEWATLGTLGGLIIASASFVTVRFDRRFDAVDRRIDRAEEHLTQRLDRLEERYVRHLELHAAR